MDAGMEAIHVLSDDWQKLCEESSAPPFYWPGWIETYLRVFEAASPLLLLRVRDGGDLIAVLPLIRKRGWYAGVPISMLRGAANVHSVRFDIMRTGSPAGAEAIPPLWQTLKNVPHWDILHLPAFAEDSACRELIRHAAAEGFQTLITRRNNGPVVRIRLDGRQAWQGGASRHFRHELRRYSRVMDQELGGPPQFVRWTEADPDVLCRFYALEASGWKGTAGTAIACRSETRAFYDKIAAAISRRGGFCLHALQFDGRMIAAAFSVVTSSCYFPLKIAYDESLHRAAPGHLLFKAILEDCAFRGIPEMYFGGDDDRFKAAWTEERIPHYDGYVFNPGILAQIAYHVKKDLLAGLRDLGRRLRIC